MPFRDLETFLEDILDSSDAISQFLVDVNYTSYETDLKTRSAVERQLQILTEAAYRLGEDAERLCPSIDWRGVRGLGNVLRHEYHAISDERIWQTLTERLPVLHQAVEVALSNLRKASRDPSA